MRVFVSLPISSNLDDEGRFKPCERSFYEGFFQSLVAVGISVESAALNEDWGRIKLQVSAFTAFDVRSIQAADGLVAVTRHRLTRDIMLELGIAVGLSKPVVVALPESSWSTQMLDGLEILGKLHLLRYGVAEAQGREIGRKVAEVLKDRREACG